jgi:hypothetical protein
MNMAKLCGKKMISARDLTDRYDINFENFFKMMQQSGPYYPTELKCVPNVDFATPVTKSVGTGKHLSNGNELRFAVDKNENPFCKELMFSEEGAQKVLKFYYSIMAGQIKNLFQSR